MHNHNGHFILKMTTREARTLCEFIHMFFETEYMDEVGLAPEHFDLLMELYGKICKHLGITGEY